MSFITKLTNKVGNAVEINMLKSDREKCIEKCEALKKKISRHDHLSNFKVEFKAEIESLQAVQKKLRTQFMHENIDVDQFMSGEMKLPGDVNDAQKSANHTSDQKDALNEVIQSWQQQKISPIDNIHSQFLRSYKSLSITIKSLHLSIAEIDKEVGVDKFSYELKLREAQEQLEEIDRKLSVVREKQFGKK